MCTESFGTILRVQESPWIRRTWLRSGMNKIHASYTTTASLLLHRHEIQDIRTYIAYHTTTCSETCFLLNPSLAEYVNDKH